MPTKKVSGEKSGTAAAGAAINFSDLASALTEAVLQAKHRLDEDAATLARQYKADPILRFIPPPSFAIGEVRVVLKFAIAQIRPESSVQRSRFKQLLVHVDTPTLRELAPHLVSELELRITPETRAAAGDDEAGTSE